MKNHALDLDRLRRMTPAELDDWIDQLERVYQLAERELIEAHGINVREFDRIVRRDQLGRHNGDASVRDALGRDST